MSAHNAVVSPGPYFIPEAPQPPDPKLGQENLRRLKLPMQLATPKGVESIEVFQSPRAAPSIQEVKQQASIASEGANPALLKTAGRGRF